MRRPLLASLLVLLVAAVALAACGSSDDDGDATSAPTTAVADANPCAKVDMPPPKRDVKARKPKRRLDPSKTWEAVVTTNCGTFTITLDTTRSPKTSASFASLARQGFYDDLTFHRIVPDWVIQGGDPLGSDPLERGTGGPGYSVVEAPPKDAQYTYGVVAMAKSAAEPDGASGSQFFVVTGDDTQLSPEYAVLGEVTSGHDTINAIGAAPLQSSDPQGAPPVDPVVIESIEIRAS